MADAKIVIIGGAADDQDHDIPDNTDPAWRVHQGANDYISISTADTEESITLGVPSGETTVIDKDGNVTMSAGLNVANSAVLGTNAVAIGEGITAPGNNAIALGFARSGQTHTASGQESIAMGVESTASNTYAISIGRGNTSSQSGSIVVGNGSKADANKSIAIAPDNATASGSNSMAIGYYSVSSQPYEQSFGAAAYGFKGDAQRKFITGQCVTTDDTATAMLNAQSGGSTALVVNTTNSTSTNKSSTTFFRVRVISSVTGLGSSFAVGDFLCREYNLAIKWFYSTGASTIQVFNDTSGTIIGENPTALVGQNTTLYSSRENVRSNTAAIAHATTGIIDSIELTTANSAARGSWNLKVESGDSSATIRHTCFIDQVDSILA